MKLVTAVHVSSLIILVGMSLLDCSLGWSSRGGRNTNCYKQHRKTRTTTTLCLSTTTDDHTSSAGGTSSSSTATTTRRDAFRKTLTNLIGGVTVSTVLLSSSASSSPSTRFGLVPAAHADVTNKIASVPALRALTRAQSQLPVKLLPDVQANNFVGVKARLREPPFDLVRKNGRVLVRGGEDGPKAGELLRAYEVFIGSVEKLDATGSLGMRGRKIKPLEMSQEYDAIVVALESFLKVGREAVEIPLQVQPSMQDNLKYGSLDTKVLRTDSKVGEEAAEIPLQEQPSMQEDVKDESLNTKVVESD